MDIKKTIEKLREKFYYNDGTLHIGGDRLKEMEAFIEKALKTQEQEHRKKLEEILKNPSYIGVLDSNEKRRGYEIAFNEINNLVEEIFNKQ